MLDEIPTHVLYDSAIGADPVYRRPVYNAANVCALQVLKQSLLLLWSTP